MSQPALHVPVAVRASSDVELSKKMLEIQSREGGRVQILTIVKDGKDWVCWYYPLVSFHGSIF